MAKYIRFPSPAKTPVLLGNRWLLFSSWLRAMKIQDDKKRTGRIRLASNREQVKLRAIRKERALTAMSDLERRTHARGMTAAAMINTERWFGS
jgi:hypothetical protein